jgi:hypothetical protein
MMEDYRKHIQGLIDDTRPVLAKHQSQQHTPEYEEYLQNLPPEYWTDKPPHYLQVSRCKVCQLLFEQIVQLVAMLPPKPVIIDAPKIKT